MTKRWGDVEDDPNFFNLDTSKSIATSTKTLYERSHLKYRDNKLKSKDTDSTTRDYVCNPTEKSLCYNIYNTEYTHFDKDMMGRSYIIASPSKHVYNFFDLDDDEQLNFLKDIRFFCEKYRISDYSINWFNQNKYHFNAKIKMSSQLMKNIK